MIIRPLMARDGLGARRNIVALGVSQTTHGWITGELARQWKPELMEPFRFSPELLVAAALHDVGHMTFDRLPRFNFKSGLPYSFQDLPCPLHLQMFRHSAEEIRPLSQYAAFFISKHTTHLTEKENKNRQSNDERALTAAFMKEAYQTQDEMLEALLKHPEYAAALGSDAINLQEDLMATWDAFSLYICGAMGAQGKLFSVPTAGEPFDLTITPDVRESAHLIVSPWPFRDAIIELRWDARVYPRTFINQEELDRHFQKLETIRLGVTLRGG